MNTVADYPTKTRDIHNHHMDSTVWDDITLRDDDIIVSTYAKAGTTWMQQMLGQMLFGPDPALAVAEMSPWVDMRVPPKAVKVPVIEGQTHRRFLKTHLPVDALVFSARAKYIYIGRDGRDVVWSLYNHHANANENWYSALNDTPGRVGPPITPPPGDIRQYWHEWLEKDGFPFWPFWENVRSWWGVKDLPNVKLIHFSDLKKDMEGRMRELAEFLDIDVEEEHWDEILEYCSFDWMKQNATMSTPLGGAFWDAGAQVFINRGTNGRWRGTLSEQEVARYEARALQELGPECARWLATGETSLPSG